MILNLSFVFAKENRSFNIIQNSFTQEYCNDSLLNSICKISSIKIKDSVSKLEMEYENISFSNKNFKILEDKVNEFVNNIISKEKNYIIENITYEENSLYLESSVSMSFYKNYICAYVSIIYWSGAHPSYDGYTFTLDAKTIKLVDLCYLTKFSKQNLYKKIVKEYNKVAKKDVSYDFDPEDYSYNEDAILQIPYTFTEDGRIFLLFKRSSLWKEPGPDIYLDIK